LLLTAALLDATAMLSCQNNGDSSQPTTLTGRTPIAPQRRLIARIREDVTGDTKSQALPAGTDLVVLDASTSTSMKVGDTLSVQLKANSGTGYQWIFAGCDNKPTTPAPSQDNTPTVLKPLFDFRKGEGKVQSTDAGKPGAPANWIFELNAAQSGSTTLHFALVRPWEKGVKPIDMRTLKVSVSANESR